MIMKTAEFNFNNVTEQIIIIINPFIMLQNMQQHSLQDNQQSIMVHSWCRNEIQVWKTVTKRANTVVHRAEYWYVYNDYIHLQLHVHTKILISCNYCYYIITEYMRWFEKCVTNKSSNNYCWILVPRNTTLMNIS